MSCVEKSILLWILYASTVPAAVLVGRGEYVLATERLMRNDVRGIDDTITEDKDQPTLQQNP